MGLFTKSIFILLIAVSTPLLYRQFANDNTITFMSSYYSNYKVIDEFLRKSASHIDSAKDYLPDSKQLHQVADKLSKHLDTFVRSGTASKKAASSASEKTQTSERFTDCPGEKAQYRLYSKDELTKFDGHQSGKPEIYLGFLGLVYNVTLGAQHYGPGTEYNVFAGRDATRAFVTGNFTHDLHDDIRDIDESMFSHIESWASFYGSNYPVLGRIEGKFFDSKGCGTAELERVHQIFNKLAQNKEEQQNLETTLPECNSEWNGDLKKGRVWCSVKSGGVERDWVGVPRVYNDGQSKRCICLNLDAPDTTNSDGLELYPNCDPKASECTLTQ